MLLLARGSRVGVSDGRDCIWLSLQTELAFPGLDKKETLAEVAPVLATSAHGSLMERGARHLVKYMISDVESADSLVFSAVWICLLVIRPGQARLMLNRTFCL